MTSRAPIAKDPRTVRSHNVMIQQPGMTIWLTGFSASGKTTIAGLLERLLIRRGYLAYRLDSHNTRYGINKGLRFIPEHESERARRVAEVARLLAEAGFVCVVATATKFRSHRQIARTLHEQYHLRFFEVFLDCPLDVVEQRDPKGLYARARRGELEYFPGVTVPYELPDAPDLSIRTDQCSAEQSAELIFTAISSQQPFANSTTTRCK